MTPVTMLELGRSMTGPTTVWNDRREARLRPEHAHRYPGLPEGWVSAATLADRVLAAALLRGRDTSLWIRLLRDEHFEFRGGGGRLVPDGGERPRREDR